MNERLNPIFTSSHIDLHGRNHAKDWLPIDEKMPIYPQDTEEYPPILICTDKAKVFLVVPERDPKMGVCYLIYFSDIWLEEKSEGTPIAWMPAPMPLTASS